MRFFDNGGKRTCCSMISTSLSRRLEDVVDDARQSQHFDVRSARLGKSGRILGRPEA